MTQPPSDDTPWTPPTPPGDGSAPPPPVGSTPPGTYPPAPGPYPAAAYPPGQYPPGQYPPGQYPPGGRAPAGTDGFAVAALVLSLLGGVLLSVIFALVALPRIRRNGTSGRGMAVAALIVSGAWVVLLVGVISLAAVSSAQRDASGTVTQEGTEDVRSVQVGDCLEDFTPSTTIRSLHVMPCTEPHKAEVIGEFDLPDGDYPGEQAILDQADARCADMVPSDLGSVDPDSLDLYYLYPVAASWALHDRTVQCIIGSTTLLTSAIGNA